MLQQVERAHTITILWKMHWEKENQGQNLHCGTSLKTTRALIFCSIFYYTDAFPNTNQISVQNSIKSRSLNLGAFLFILFYKPCHIQLITMQSKCYHFFFRWCFSLLPSCQSEAQEVDEHVCQISVLETSASVPSTCYTDSDSVGVEDVNRRWCGRDVIPAVSFKHTEKDGAGTNFHNSRMFYWMLWSAVAETIIPNMEQSLKINCLFEIYHVFLISYVYLCAWWWQEDAIFLPAFPSCKQQSQTMVIRYGLASKAGCRNSSSINSPELMIIGCLLSKPLQGNPEELCQKAIKCFDQWRKSCIKYTLLQGQTANLHNDI